MENIEERMLDIHKQINIKHGLMYEEIQEQMMALNYLKGDEKVLEIGGNIGRNSLLIGHILNQYAAAPGASPTPVRLVTFECNPEIAKCLEENRDANNMIFHIESAALSKRKLIQRGYETIPSDIVHPGYLSVDTITLEELNLKYGIEFDTLVLDCEGAFYYILEDMPEILNNIKLIIMENDYFDIEKKNYVDKILTQNGFYVDYVKPGGFGPCFDKFFETWLRK